MVLIDGVKYACQSCIKGHRSSKCTHTTRPLQEIKKKGRPTSQCAHCRDLRKTKSVHARCDCAARAKEKEDKPAPRLLPNGLVDAMLLASLVEEEGGDPEASGSGESKLVKTDKSGVTLLLNPCDCLNGGKCTCCTAVAPSSSKSFPGNSTSSGGCCGSGSSSTAKAKLSEVSSVTKKSGCCGGSSPPLPTPESFFVEPEQPPIQPGDIPVLPSASASHGNDCDSPASHSSFISTLPSSQPSLALPSSSSSSLPNPLLFTPSTQGTSSCFCGPTCSCVGCAVHDPIARKRPADGGCDGGGCRCGDPGAAGCGGKRARTGADRKKTSGGGCCGAKKAIEEEEPVVVEKPKRGGGCCGSKKGKAVDRSNDLLPPNSALPTTSGIELPSLWALQEEDVGATGEAVAPPLPSLKTLWPALVDPSTMFALPASSSPAILPPLDPLPALPSFLSTITSISDSPSLPTPSRGHLVQPSELSSSNTTGYISVTENSSGCGHLYGDAFAPACGEDAMVDAGEEAPGCECSSGCGCKSGVLESGQGGDTDADGETDPDYQAEEEEGWVSVQKSADVAADQELEELARKAEMGLFG
ncbi:hypothetical protein JCM11251_000734 [Rhodosporidiobolus azoricus]